MGCCDKKRAVLVPAGRPRAQASRAGTRDTRPGPRVSQARTTPAAVSPSRVTVRYAGTKKIRVRGTATGSVYHCSASSRMLSVDVRDVAALLRTGQFTA